MKAYAQAWLAVMVLAFATLAVAVVASQPARAAGPWYVASGGNDSNSCLSPAAACASINGALNKPAFVAGDTIRVAAGLYISTGNEVVLLNKNATLSGGWNATFTTQSGMSTLDGQGARRGIRVNSEVIAAVERLVVQNGYAYLDNGGGIYNEGNLTVISTTVFSNTASTGGGIYTYSGVLTLTNSAVISNFTDFNSGGGIFNIGGTLILNNSTVANNATPFCGGGIYSGPFLGATTKDAYLFLNSSTVNGNIAGHCGGGVTNGQGSTATSQNTILAGNGATQPSGDCNGTISSLGYNLLGNTSGCTFAPSSGDLLNVDAGIVVLAGQAALRPGSPAIDTGNPSGCADHLGNPITTDQRGVMRPLDGNGDGNAICDIGAYEFDPNNPIKQVFLSIATRNFCADFFDDFGNLASGWPVGEDDLVRVEYLNGEYRILSKSGDYIYLFRSPSCDRENYVVEVDARWVGTPGLSYGIVFGITSGFGQYYLFDVSANFQDFLLARRDPGGFTLIVPPTFSPAINGATATNHLKVTRNGSQITLEVNGTVLGAWFDDVVSGSTGAGIYSNPYIDLPVSDARFDNFSLASLSGSGLAVHRANALPKLELPFIPVEHIGLPVHVDRLPFRDDLRSGQE